MRIDVAPRFAIRKFNDVWCRNFFGITNFFFVFFLQIHTKLSHLLRKLVLNVREFLYDGVSARYAYYGWWAIKFGTVRLPWHLFHRYERYRLHEKISAI